MVGTLCVFTYRIKAGTFFYKIETQIIHYGMLGEQENDDYYRTPDQYARCGDYTR